MSEQSQPCVLCKKQKHESKDVCAGWPSAEDLRLIADDSELSAGDEQAIYKAAHRLEDLEKKVTHFETCFIATCTSLRVAIEERGQARRALKELKAWAKDFFDEHMSHQIGCKTEFQGDCNCGMHEARKLLEEKLNAAAG
jgi:hypothetical protein